MDRNARASGWDRWRVAGVLAVALAANWAVLTAAAAEPQIHRISDQVVEVTGEGWRLRYGTMPAFDIQLLAIDRERSYFSHAEWLRLIDTKKGVVVGRWHFPGKILHLSQSANKVLVEFQYEDESLPVSRQKLEFDPLAPNVPDWPTTNVQMSKAPRIEATFPEMPKNFFRINYFQATEKLPLQQAHAMLPMLRENVERDPLSPWLRLALFQVLADLGDPSAETLDRMLEVSKTDFTELLNLSYYLDLLGEHGQAQDAFELGYKDYWKRGYDPRLMTALWPRFLYYGGVPWSERVEFKLRHAVIDRLYRISPYNETADLAWQAYAGYLEKRGMAEVAGVWSARANDASAAGQLTSRGHWRILDLAILSIVAIFAAGLLYLQIRFRYRNQLRIDAAAAKQGKVLPRTFWLGNLVYWSWRERIGFLSLVLVAWYVIGLTNELTLGVELVAGMPITLGTGSFAGPATSSYLENKLPATPERDLLLAFAHQQSGDNEKAERLYRALPGFAESWNNLGVLLLKSGRKQEARQAFEHALRIDPQLAEASLNLGSPPETLWTKLHREFLPDSPMLAPPKISTLVRAFYGGSLTKIFVLAVGGPFTRSSWTAGPVYLEYGQKSSLLLKGLFVGIVVLALALVFLIPARDVTQPPGRTYSVLELIIPGLSYSWSFFGGLVLFAWCFFLLQPWWFSRYGWSIARLVSPNWVASYGIPEDAAQVEHFLPGQVWFQPTGPGWLWLYGPPILLFVVNLVLVLWRRRAERPSITIG